jgi:hypothetical protein
MKTHFLILFLFLTHLTFAQTKENYSFSFKVGNAFPLSGNYTSAGGGGATIAYKLNERNSFYFTGDFLQFDIKNPTRNSSFAISAKLGYKKLVLPSHYFIYGEGGFGRITPGRITQIDSTGINCFSFQLGAGRYFPVMKGSRIFATFGYNGLISSNRSFNWLAVNIGYELDLNLASKKSKS